jgi:hypothetical protein
MSVGHIDMTLCLITPHKCGSLLDLQAKNAQREQPQNETDYTVPNHFGGGGSAIGHHATRRDVRNACGGL